MKQNKLDAKIWKICIAVCVILSVVTAIVKIFVGFDIDEAYAVTMPYRLLQGDKLFTDMWEVHQTSSFLPAVLCAVFVKLTGDIDYLVLFLRVAATMVHFFVTAWLYAVIKKAIRNRSNERKAETEQGNYVNQEKNGNWCSVIPWFSALVYFNFLPKWMISFDFSMQQLWFTTISLLFLYEAVTKDKKIHFFTSGLSLAAAVLAYPGMVFVYPFLLVSIWVLTAKMDLESATYTGTDMKDSSNTCGKKRSQSKMQIQNCIYFTVGCMVAAVVFFVYLFSYMSLQQLFEAIPMVFSDGSHQYDMATKLLLYAKQWLEVLVQSAILVVPCIIITFVYVKIFKVKFTFPRFFAIFLMLTSGIVVFAELVGISWGPFRLQVRYLLLFFGGIYFYLRGKKERTQVEKLAFWIVLFPTIGMLLGILLASNVGPSSSASYLVVGCIASILFMAAEVMKSMSEHESAGQSELCSEHESTGQSELCSEHEMIGLTETCSKHEVASKIRLSVCNADKILVYGSVFVFLLSLMMCKGFYVRVTEYPPANVLEERARITQGAAKGIWVYPEDCQRIEADYCCIADESKPGDKILFLGTESLNNLTQVSDNKSFVSPTTISTPAFNEQWTSYFTMYPEKRPDVIFIAKNTIDNREKFFAKNHFGKWIFENYDVENMTETDSLCVIK